MDVVRDHLWSSDLGDDYWQRQAAMMSALLDGDPVGIEQTRRWLDLAVARQTNDGRLCLGGFARVPGYSPTAVVSSYFASPLLMLHRRTGETAYLAAAERQLDAVRRGPRTSAGYFMIRHDAPEVKIDSVYPVCGALALLGTATARQELVDEAYRQLAVAIRRLVDPRDGLARHTWCERPNTYPDSSFWSRGNGWLIAAAAEVLDEAPDHPQAEEVRRALGSLLRRMAELQDRSGLLHDILDDPTSQLEASGSLLFAYAAASAFRQGIADATVLTAAQEAFLGVCGLVDATGGIGSVWLAPMVDRAGSLAPNSSPPGTVGAAHGSMVLAQSFALLAMTHLQAADPVPSAQAPT